MNGRILLRIAAAMSLGFCCLIAYVAWVIAYGIPEQPTRGPVRSVLAGDPPLLYSDIVDGGLPCIASRSLARWNDGWTVLARNARNPMLSRDGKALVYEERRWYRTLIHRRDLESGETKLIATVAGDAHATDVDALGTRVAGGLSTWNYGGKAAPPTAFLTTSGGRTRVAWGSAGAFVSPTGVAYVGITEVGKEGMWICDSEKPEDLPFKGEMPLFSNDGSTLVYVRSTRRFLDAWEWFAYQRTSREEREIGSMFEPVFLNGGNRVLSFNSTNRRRIDLHDVESGERRTVADFDGCDPRLHSGVGGTVVACTRDDHVEFLIFDSQAMLSQVFIAPR